MKKWWRQKKIQLFYLKLAKNLIHFIHLFDQQRTKQKSLLKFERRFWQNLYTTNTVCSMLWYLDVPVYITEQKEACILITSLLVIQSLLKKVTHTLHRKYFVVDINVFFLSIVQNAASTWRWTQGTPEFLSFGECGR